MTNETCPKRDDGTHCVHWWEDVGPCCACGNDDKEGEDHMDELNKIDFGWALDQLRAGNRVQRQGWNGKGMSLALMPGYMGGVPANAATTAAWDLPPGATVQVRPYIAMRDAQGCIVPWLASQTDMLAEDWQLA